MKTFFAFTTGVLVGMIGIATMFMGSPEVRDVWNTTAEATK